MLSPSQLESIPNNIVELYSQLEEFIILDFSRRLKKVGSISSTAEYQRQRASILGIKNIEAKIAATLNLSYKQIESLFPEIAAASIAAESEIYKKAGYKAIGLNDSQALKDYLSAAIKNTKGDIENITQSLGFAEVQNGHVVYNDIAKFYQKELNLAHVKIVSGVQDYNSAIKQAVKKLTDSGLRTIDYESGWSQETYSASRRAILTGVHQMNQEMTNNLMNELVEPQDQYAETTAHANPRPTHAPWAGRVFKVHGSTKDYPNLAETTGLGTIQGLQGAGCRHSYHTFILGASVRAYTDEQLKYLDTPDFEYKGKTYTGYEATQYQRKIETAIRSTKRDLIGYKESGLTDDFKASSIKLQQLKHEYKQFSSASGIRQKLERSQVQGFDRSISQQAVNSSKNKN